MLDITFDIRTSDGSTLANDVPEDITMTIVKAIIEEKGINEIIISEHK